MPAPAIPQRSRRDLRGFIALLEARGQLRRISAPVDPDLELAAIADRVLAMGGPALLFENVIGSPMPVAVNLLGTVERVLWSMGMEEPQELETLGERLALLQQPRPPKGLKEVARFGRQAVTNNGTGLTTARERVPLVVLMKIRLPPTNSRVTASGELPRS